MRRDFFMGFLDSFGVIVVVEVAPYILPRYPYLLSLARIAHLQWYFVGLARYQYYV